MAWIGGLIKKLIQPKTSAVPDGGMLTTARAAADFVPVKWLIVYEFEYMTVMKRDCITVWAIGEDEARRLGREKIQYCSGRLLSVSRIVN